MLRCSGARVGDKNQAVLIKSRGEIGKTVGDGSCWAFVHKVLTKAGAASSTTTGEDDDYVWGTPIELKDIQPGDVLQFRDFVIKTVTETEIDAPDGSGGTDQKFDEKFRGHHSAVVDAIMGPNSIKIIEQHVKPGPKVKVNVIPLRNEVRPTTRVTKDYKDRQGRIHHGATYTTTVTIEIRGKVWAYRPVAAR
jgi:hypothetical protein